MNYVSGTKILVDTGEQSMKPKIGSHFNLKVIPQYCIAHPFLLSKIFASLACAHERVHVHNLCLATK